MMRFSVLFCSIFTLHLLPCIQSRPVHEVRPINRYKEVAEWSQKSHHYSLKKRGRQGRVQETAKGLYPGQVPTGNVTDLWNRPRCGNPDYPMQKPTGKLDYERIGKEDMLGGRLRRKRFVLFGGRWDKRDLTYKVVRFPWQMSEEKVRHVLQEALRVWSEVTPLRFAEVQSGKADIIIDFTRYWHGDNLPFDGPGGILAHAFFPRTHREGDIHFDYDESWTVGNSMGTDLLQVAAHEFGHVLGLQHSLVDGAIMSPFYSFSYPLKLSEDDKRGIQYLYGAAQVAPPHITETNEIDTNLVPDACRTNFDAVSMIRGELFFFKSRYVWRIRDGQLQAGYPALASRHWSGIPDNIDAAYEDKSGNIWFFQGDSYWVFDAERKITGPDSVQRLGLPVSDIQAALMWGEEQSQKIYLFKAGTYWRFSPQENRVDAANPRSMQDWRGVPINVDAAFQDKFGYAHFLSGLEYWKFDAVDIRVLEGYPRSIGMDFFGCSASLHQ